MSVNPRERPLDAKTMVLIAVGTATVAFMLLTGILVAELRKAKAVNAEQAVLIRFYDPCYQNDEDWMYDYK